jgi:hypothetical protein
MNIEIPPDEVLLEAAKLCGRDRCSVETVRDRWHLEGTLRALCSMIQKHEAFKQEVSDAMKKIVNDPNIRLYKQEPLYKFIISEPKPDPLVEVLADLHWLSATNKFRTALEARGLEIREKQP